MACPFCQQEHGWTIEEALDRLAAGPGVITKSLDRASPDELNWAPSGKWSAKQVVIHLLDTELIYGVRARKILAEENGALPSYDQDAWADACTKGRNIDAALTTFAALRADNIALFRAGMDRLDRTGTHPDYGKLSLRDLILHLSPHDEKHAGQIKRVRDAYKDVTH